MVEKLQRFYRWTWWQLVLAENRSWLESWPILSKRSCTVARFVFPLKTSIVTKNAAQGISMHRNHFTFEVGSFSIIALGSTIELIESIEPFSLRSTRNILSVISSVDTWKAQFFLILSINFKIESNIYIYILYIIDEFDRLTPFFLFLFLGCSSFLLRILTAERRRRRSFSSGQRIRLGVVHCVKVTTAKAWPARFSEILSNPLSLLSSSRF